MDGAHRGREEERRRELIQHLLGPAVHKLNNSMAVVSGLTALLHEQERVSTRRKHFESVEEQAAEATALIRELGQLAHMQSALVEQAEDVDLGNVLLRAGSLIDPLCRSLRVGFEVPALHAAGTRRTVRAGANALVQQLASLAAEILPDERLPSPGALLRMRVRDAEGAVRIDLGYRGLEGEVASDPERRADMIAEARRCAEAWGGGLTRRDRGPHGAVVWELVAPAALEDTAEIPRPTTAARILVLETDAQLGTLIGDVLTDVGHEVEVPSDPAGFDTTKAGGWDLVLFDSGSRSLALEAARGASASAVRMCSYGTDVEPGEHVLQKPFRPTELIECVRAVLGN
jgi:hypothetical protein